MPTARPSRVYDGHVAHTRIDGPRHHFRYRSFSFLIDLDEIDRLDASLRLFSHNRFNVFTLNDRDFGPRDGSTLKPWALEQLAAAGIELKGGSISLLFYPRVLGTAFNPLSAWFAHDAGGQLKAILYEVSNTFGEWHHYVVAVGEADQDGLYRHRCPKKFHVSPFIGMQATYGFSIAEPDQRLRLLIRETGPEGPIMVASQTGKAHPLVDRVLARLALVQPLHAAKVVVAIHWQALRLWLKGARYRRNPGTRDRTLTGPHMDATS